MDNQMGIIQKTISEGRVFIGMEFGSTRIKIVLIDENHQVLASGQHEWTSQYIQGNWTYDLEDVWSGLRAGYRQMKHDVARRYGLTLTKASGIGISGMMHGYLVFDRQDNLLTPFRTWRNNSTSQAAGRLSRILDYPIPHRWSVAHLGQSILDGHAHIPQVDFMTTLAGYIHWKLTGHKVLGICDASGMFPIDVETHDFDHILLEKFDKFFQTCGHPWKLQNIMPEILLAGDPAGSLTQDGALLIDPEGDLPAGIPLCPPEGDAGTGMVATNSIAARTGNVSAGTSIFGMVVLEKKLSRVHDELDLVTTPDGSLVAMAHANNCTADYDAWINLIGEAIGLMGFEVNKGHLYESLLKQALQGDADCHGLMAYGYLSGEHMTGFEEGRPLFARAVNSNFSLANFMRVHLFSALCALRTGFQKLSEDEGVRVDEIRGHGGFFKTPEVGQRMLAAALNVPVTVSDVAGEGGAWGIAILASYRVLNTQKASLSHYLSASVFKDEPTRRILPDPDDVEGFMTFYKRYQNGLPVEQAAIDCL